MELRHLTYFLAVVDEGGFTRAATRLHVVQSAVSAGVRALERELGATLLDRERQPVAPTDAGAALLPHARATLDAAREARDAVGAVRGGLRGTVRLGTLTTAGTVDLPALLGAMHRRHPGVLVRLVADPSGSAGLVAALREHRLDVAFVSVPGPAPAGVDLVPLATSPMDLVVPRDHPLAARAGVTVPDLADLDFVDFPEGYGNRAVTDRAFGAAGVRRRVTIEITDVRAGTDYIRHGLGVGLLPRVVLGEDAALVQVPVRGADVTWPLQLATASGRRPGAAARALVELVRARTGEASGPAG
ncbi:LysR family transcriptional regulator [Cellulomonas endophytica]|uniref:LysR family transcriptional regulator n=1 Tax=Cellulomonas endophytica TaxID=2494735 RepID=UPI001011FB8E|nr:LysR family transcriptional regulator [Cellulomonas endophytica]